jgi:dihydrofolate reductase
MSVPLPGMPGLSVIAAYDRRRAIGRNNALPWHLPDDLKRFKALTMGRPVLMGYRTALAIGRVLPGRRNLVLSRAHAAPFAGQEIVRDFDAVRAAERDLCVIGGGEVFALALPHARALHLTEIDTEIDDADAHFPALAQEDWVEVDRIAHAPDARHRWAFSFVDCMRRRA